MLLIYLYREGQVSCKNLFKSNCIDIDNKIIIMLRIIKKFSHAISKIINISHKKLKVFKY